MISSNVKTANEIGLLLAPSSVRAFQVLREAAEKMQETGRTIAKLYYNSPRQKAKRAHTAFCLVRMTTPKEHLLNGLPLAEPLARAERSLAPPLELIANSLTSHAPPLEPDTKSGTGSS